MPQRTALSKNEFDALFSRVGPLKEGFEFLGDPVIITDEHANILFANKAMEKNTGFSREEVLGRNPGDLWGGQMPKEFYKDMWKEIKEKKLPFVGEVQNKRKDGTLYWQELHISPLLDEHGKVKFFIAIEPNITDKKEREKFRGEFISVLAHQMKSPLTTTKWIIELLLTDTKLTADQAEYVKTLNTANESAVNLIGDLLTLGRIFASKQGNDVQNLSEELPKIIASVQTLNSTVKISLKAGHDCAMEMPIIALQIFLNLIANAAEYSDKTDPEVEVVLEKEKSGALLFSVKDNGLTISREDAPKIYSKFFRTEDAKERKATGSGLGLFIVKLLCDKFGWEQWFQSPPEGMKDGAEFFVRIRPIKPEEERAAKV